MYTTSANVTNLFKFNAGLLCAVNVFFAFVGVFLNSVVIMSLLNSKLWRKLCYFMILVLACFDLALVVVVHPLLIIGMIDWLTKTKLYSIELYHLEHLFVFSLTGLLTMTIERYLAMVYPFFHRKVMTKSRLIVILALLQLPFGIPYFTLLNKNSKTYRQSYVLALIAVVFLVTFFLNYKIFVMVKTLQRRADIPLGILNGSEQGNIVKEPKVPLGKVSACLLAVLCLSVCYSPTIVLMGLKLSALLDWGDQTIFQSWAATLLTINSTLNSLIFFYKNSTLRRHGKIIMAKCFFFLSRGHDST